MPDWSRRSFLLRSAAVGVGAVVAGIGGRQLLERQLVAPPGASAAIPPAAETVPALAAGADLSPSIESLTPIVMPTERFYRIDTALLVPGVDTATWSLRIHGLVDRETTLSWEELIALPMFEQYTTIACVSNEVGGKLVGNAKWTGVRLRDVLALAGVQASASQLVGRSVDGWTAGMPMEWVMDPSREPMIAVKMNDEALPPLHGYPARLIVPGLYGYVSATKWLTELEVTTWEAFDGYWVPLGWSKTGPDPHAVAHRYAQERRDGQRPDPDRRRGLGAGPRDREGRGRHRRRLARGATVDADLGCDLGPVGPGVGRDARATTRSWSARPTASARPRRTVRTPPAPDGARGWDASHVRGA